MVAHVIGGRLVGIAAHGAPPRGALRPHGGPCGVHIRLREREGRRGRRLAHAVLLLLLLLQLLLAAVQRGNLLLGRQDAALRDVHRAIQLPLRVH
jgi:hypothetical protein